MAAAAALAEVHQARTWIGFNTQAHCDSICNEASFESLEDLVGLTEKDIREMADGYEKPRAHPIWVMLSQATYWSTSLGSRPGSMLLSHLSCRHCRCRQVSSSHRGLYSTGCLAKG